MPWWRTKQKFSCEHLRDLCQEVVQYGRSPERGSVETVIEALREISEIVVWGDRNEPKIFDLFLELHMLPHFIHITLSRAPSTVKIQIIQTLSILLGNLKSLPSVFYLLSGDFMNKLIECEFDFDDDEVLSNYINFLKSLSLRFDIATIQFFFNRDHKTFPMYSAALKLIAHPEPLVRAGVRSIFMNICSVDDEYVRKFVLGGKRYQHTLCWHVRQLSQSLDNEMTKLEESVNHCLFPVAFPPVMGGVPTLLRVDNVVQDLVDDFHYVQDLHSLESAQLRQAVQCGLRGVLLDPFLSASLRGLPEGTAQISRHTAIFLFAQWAGCICRSPEICRTLLDSLSCVPFTDPFDDAPALSSPVAEPGQRRALAVTLGDAWEDDDARVPAACVATVFRWATAGSPEMMQLSQMVPHKVRREAKSESASAEGSTPQLAPVGPDGTSPSPRKQTAALASTVTGEEEESSDDESQDRPPVAELTGSFILRREQSQSQERCADPTDDSDIRPVLPAMPQVPPRPPCASKYLYPFDTVECLLLYLCRCIRDLRRRGRLESIFMCCHSIAVLCDVPGEPVSLAPSHAALLRDAYRTCCCVLRRRLELFRRELLTDQTTMTGVRSRSNSGLSDGVERDVCDPLELVFLLLSGEIGTYKEVRSRRPRDLSGDVTQLLPLLSPLVPPQGSDDSARPLSVIINASVRSDEVSDEPLIEPPMPRGPSTPPLRHAQGGSPPRRVMLPEAAAAAAGPEVGSPAVRTRQSGSPMESAPASPQKPGDSDRAPGTYKVVGHAGAMVRKHEGLDSKLVHRLKQGAVVEVTEVRKRRCYISRPVQGWVSMWNSMGGMILQPIGTPDPTSGGRSGQDRRLSRDAQTAGVTPAWLRAVPLQRRLPHTADEVAQVEAGTFFCVRDLVFQLADRPNEIEEYLQVQQGGPYLASLGESIDTSCLLEGVRCQSCPEPAPARNCMYCSSDFLDSTGTVLYLFVEGDELLLLLPSISQMHTAKLVCSCYLYFSYATVDTRLGFRLSLTCRDFQCSLTFESCKICQQVARRINQLARDRREGKCARLAPVLMDSEIPIDPAEADVET
eukprot:TRINITY_DN14724_c0_g1_i1.p1 TRINITY_DN14724_c0_g1~~TRINITY_DN14724_c0_g1_i1.p1  ORF type:complete len:1075 (+),score=211.44 TRINITY_DN14724_c0_g1_i1:104-3328(+)